MLSAKLESHSIQLFFLFVKSARNIVEVKSTLIYFLFFGMRWANYL